MRKPIESQAIAAMMKVKVCDEVQALGEDMAKEIQGIVDMIAALKTGFAPRARDIPKMTTMCRDCLRRCEFFFKLEIAEEKVGVAKSLKAIGKRKEIRGADALRRLFTLVGDKVRETPKLVKMIQLKPLKQYNWVFDNIEQGEIRQWLRVAAGNETDGSKSLAIADGWDEGNTAIVISGSAAVSSCCAAVASSDGYIGAKGKHGHVLPGATKKETAEASKKAEARQEVNQFFKGKSRRALA